MALRSIQLCHMDPQDREKKEFTVTINSDDGNFWASLTVQGEDAARHLRDTLRQYADNLRSVGDYRPRRQQQEGMKAKGKYYLIENRAAVNLSYWCEAEMKFTDDVYKTSLYETISQAEAARNVAENHTEAEVIMCKARADLPARIWGN